MGTKYASLTLGSSLDASSNEATAALRSPKRLYTVARETRARTLRLVLGLDRSDALENASIDALFDQSCELWDDAMPAANHAL